jgi:hypothetical protein
MLPPGTESFQQQLANLQQQLGQMFPQPPAPAAPVPVPGMQPDSVDGIDGAREYLGRMAASTKHYVWDRQADRFYVLQKDANGNPLRIMIGDFTLTPEPSMEDKYVTREDFNALVAKLNDLLGQKGPDNG